MLDKTTNPLNLKDPDLLRMQGLVGGKWCDADSGATLEVTNPATGEVIGTTPKMGQAETRRAIEAAKKELNKMSDEDMQKLLEKGRQMQNDPKIKKKIKEMGLDQAL